MFNITRHFRRLYPTTAALTTTAIIILLIAGQAFAADRTQIREREELLKYQEAVRIFREQNSPEEAYDLFESFLKMHPKSEFADDALLEQARIQIYVENPKKARALLKTLLKKHPASSLRKRAFIEMEMLDYKGNKWKDCIEAADNALSLDPLPDEAAQILMTRARCLVKRRAAQDAIADAVSAYRAAITDKARNMVLDGINEMSADLRDRHIERALDTSDGDAPYGYLAFLSTNRDVERGHYEIAINSLMDILVDYPDQIPDENIKSTFNVLRNQLLVKSNTIGAVLPLTGQYGVFGQKALQGIQAALGFMSPAGNNIQGVDYTLIVKDSGTDPVQAAQVVRDLAESEQVIGIIGPLFSRTSRAAAQVAEGSDTPMISLSADPEVSALGENIFRRSLTDTQQITALVRMSHDRLMAKRFAFLLPDTAYGNGMMHLFWDELDKVGAEVTGVETFAPGQTDFGPQIRSLVGLDRPLTTEQRELRDSGMEIELEPVIDFDALFIPADFQTIGLLAPQLVFYDVDKMLVLGANGWNNPWMPELGEHYVDGALFTGGYVTGTGEKEATEMEQRYWLTFGEDPLGLAVQAYNAARIIRSGIESGMVRDRSSLRKYIAELADHPSAEGPLTTDENGDILQKPHILTVKKGEIVPFVFTID